MLLIGIEQPRGTPGTQAFVLTWLLDQIGAA